MKRMFTLKSTLQSVAFMVLSCIAINANAQSTPFELTTLGTPLVVDFNDFRGQGFTPAPAVGSGQLNSNNWYIYGFTDGVLQFGGTQTSGDFARDTTSGGLQFSGGIYSLNRGSGNHALWIQPTGSDANPGVFTMRILNNTGSSLDSVTISYDVIVYNDQPRAQVVRFEVGAMDTIFQPLPTMTYLTPEVADNQFHVANRTITMPTGGVPNGAYLYGRWITKDSLGSGSRDELGIDNISVIAYGSGSSSAQPCSDLFFSEYIEGSSNNKAIEIYNPTANPINLSNYRVELYSNGATSASQVEILTGTLAAGDVYIIANASSNATILAKADITSNVTFFNGDDALALIKGVSDTIDVIGTIGFDPGSEWPVDTASTSNNTIVRKPTVQQGETNWAVAMNQWNAYPIDFLDSLGTHMMNSCGTVVVPQPCGDLFFSEYIEGSSNNKAVEIYNPTANPINLSNYRIEYFPNGSTSSTVTYQPTGVIAPGGVFVYAADAADTTILKVADDSLSFPSPVHFNGDDAFALIKGIDDTLDIFGTIGIDPGSSWPVGSGTTANQTLVRKASVQQGEKDWANGMNQWDVFPTDMFDSLGAHTMVPCGVVVPPTFNFSASSINVNEGAGNATITVEISDPADCTIEVALDAASTATAGTDFTFTSPQVLTFTAAGGTTQTITIPINDDNIAFEGTETIMLNLQSVGGSGGCAIGSIAAITVNIIDNDYPVYTIAEIHGEDALGVADSDGVKAELRGVVTFHDIRGTGVQFYMQDATAGINIFNFNDDYGYTAALGDSIIVRGTIDQFSGLTEIIPDTIILASTGNQMPEPIVTDTLYEELESHLVKIIGYEVIDPAQWTNSGSGFNVDLTNGTDTITIRIDNDVDIYGTPAPTGMINLVGVVTQFDGSSPYFDGYQVLARSMADITTTQMPIASFTVTDDELEVEVINTSTNDPTSLSWNFDDGTIITDQDTVVHMYAAAGTYDICLTASNPAGSNTTCQTVTVQGVGIDEALKGSVSIYPVPVTHTLTIEMEITITRVEVVDITGKIVKTVAPSNTKATVNMNELSNGIYLVKIHTEKGIVSKKVMKQ